MKSICCKTGLLLTAFLWNAVVHAQENQPVVAKTDTLTTQLTDTLRKTTNNVVTDSPGKKKKNKRKKDQSGDNPYLVNTPPAKPIPYNSPKEKEKKIDEPVIGGILKEIITDKKRN